MASAAEYMVRAHIRDVASQYWNLARGGGGGGGVCPWRITTSKIFVSRTKRYLGPEVCSLGKLEAPSIVEMAGI